MCKITMKSENVFILDNIFSLVILYDGGAAFEKLTFLGVDKAAILVYNI